MIFSNGLLADVTGDYDFFPEAASTFAESNDWLFGAISWIGVAFFVPIAFCLFYFAVKYRKANGEKAESNVAHNTPLEVAWSVFPSFFLVGMFVLGAKSYLDQRMVPEGAYEIGVKAYQWGWSFDYGAGVTNPELHLVVDEPFEMAMRSQDVIHSLYIPAFRAKKDIVPGRLNYMWFMPTKVSETVSEAELAEGKALAKELGVWDLRKIGFTQDGYRYYDLFCTEYCGTNHSQMNA
ncbi:MAG: cytochrome c oxidase subunit II, partial [Planctomycetota bacterium]